MENKENYEEQLEENIRYNSINNKENIELGTIQKIIKVELVTNTFNQKTGQINTKRNVYTDNAGYEKAKILISKILNDIKKRGIKANTYIDSLSVFVDIKERSNQLKISLIENSGTIPANQGVLELFLSNYYLIEDKKIDYQVVRRGEIEYLVEVIKNADEYIDELDREEKRKIAMKRNTKLIVIGFILLLLGFAIWILSIR